MNWLSRKKIWLVGLVFVLTAWVVFFVFRNGQIDEWATGTFYNESAPDYHWPLKEQLWVQIAYKGGSIFTGIWGLGIIIVFGLGFWIPVLKRYRSFCVLSFLLLAIGPGLLVNAVFKDNWGRPRPRETVAFGGDQSYQAPFVISDRGGKSFPCGHCSVGFALSIVAVWGSRRSKKNGWIVGGWMAALILGGYLGAARIVVGAHYLSDVICSGLFVFIIAWILDLVWPEKRVETEADLSSFSGKAPNKSQILLGSLAGVVLLLAVVFIALLAFPVNRTGFCSLEFSNEDLGISNGISITGEALEYFIGVKGDKGSLKWDGPELVKISTQEPLILSYELSGFGFPWSSIEIEHHFEKGTAETPDTVLLDVLESGYFKELNVRLMLANE